MSNGQENIQSIYRGYHPRTHDGSTPQTRSLSEAVAVMEAFNKEQSEDRFRAELVKIAYTDLCAVAVRETKIDKVWQYI